MRKKAKWDDKNTKKTNSKVTSGPKILKLNGEATEYSVPNQDNYGTIEHICRAAQGWYNALKNV